MTDSIQATNATEGAADDGLDARRKRILFRTWHRGMKEMDLLLGGFTKAEIGRLSDAELDELEEIITVNDQDLYAWITGRKPLPGEWDRPLFRRMLAFHDIRLG
ncbi:succinate dehydrogenase assembly factor 2 [Microvirga tunisiensis]|uniref:Succinate dehydrogenase assembly factor 2 n=2 Tax=Pannonibacter tanglangensis TaxID=2750084 RepID=A0ABW9ZHB6_9HYPH|nr:MULTISPECIES: succinate dehydrogenase assembly factor 2 [unclassified Pannonibacter]NBN62100.1 succinate dehydrogenase assembly factor 2 [Pannonibacter sp. XCT-34]NBN77770.1 succinate dehydrogenase assembly factor 2 [Pannonibacter sp. XCT-53]